MRNHGKAVYGSRGLLRDLTNRPAVLVICSASYHEQGFFAGARKRHADDATRRRNQPEKRPGAIEYLHTRVGSDVQPSFRIDCHAIAIAPLKHREIPPVGEQARGLDVESDERTAIGDIKCLVVRAECDAVGAEVIPYDGDPFGPA